ncbi:hypothetical protein TL16_g02442 [Triparma laevis f. inornata]|uniref:Uncharacterized protein n=2 Tax=Triparma laevis TaxID=1534972 RepID=A0A9W7AYN2_9STRA|nr:hypothetical protein TL16_g02442 [Triparma laevis f. inornata]GMH76809.1 hypothetical protein TrLO_g2669 [Triparma laevis f. longispina]
MYKSELLLPKLCTNWDQISDYIKLKNIASSVELILVFFTSLSLKIKSLQSFELNTFLKTADSLIASLSKQIKISTGEFGLIKNPVSEIVSVVSCEKVRLKKVLEMRIRKLSPFKWDLEGGKGKFWDFFKGTVELISDERVSRLLELSNPPLAELSKPGVFILLLQKPSFKILKYYSTLTGTGCFEEEIVSDTVEWKEVKKGIKWKGSLRREFVDVILNSGKETLTQIGEIEVALDIWRKILIGSVRDRVKVLMNYKFLYGLSGPVLNLGIRIIEEGEGWGDLEVLGLRFKEEGDELEKCEVREESEIWAREGFWCLKEGKKDLLTFLMILRSYSSLRSPLVVFKNVKNSEGKKGGRDVGKMFRRERRWERKRVGEKRKEEEREKTGWW